MLSHDRDTFPLPQTSAASEVAGREQRTITLAIIDGHDAVHAGIKAWCADADPPIEIVGGFSDPQTFFNHCAGGAHGIDVVVFDPQWDAGPPRFDLLGRLCLAGCRVIAYSRLTGDEVILTSLDLGATTYLVKAASRDHLIAAVHAVRAPIPYVGPEMARALLKARTVGRTNLSQREKEVLVAWLQTGSKEFVAQRLAIAPTTVRTHLQRIREKYEAVGRRAPTKSALLARAIEDGLLGLADLSVDRERLLTDQMLSA